MTLPKNNLFTLFTTFKPFEGESDTLQSVAIASWAANNLPVIVFGDEAGAADAARHLGAKHVTDVRRSKTGVPYISDMMAKAAAVAETPYVALVNGDIVLDAEFVSVLTDVLMDIEKSASETRHLISARRRNLPIVKKWSSPFETLQRVAEIDQADGHWDMDNAIDIFVYDKDLYHNVPDLAVGRSGWDNWLLWAAKEAGASLVDLSLAAALKHPIHGYCGPMGGWAQLMTNQDTLSNRALVEDKGLTFLDFDACWVSGQLVPLTAEVSGKIAGHCRPDAEAELRAALRYLQLSDISDQERVDACRSVLWRLTYFFQKEQTEFGDTNLIAESVELCRHGKFEDAVFFLQEMLNEPLDRLISTGVEKLFVWGGGSMGASACNYLSRKHPHLQLLVISKDTPAPGRFDANIQAIKPAILGNEDRPFVLIASMYVDEILKENSHLLASIDAFISY